MKTKKKFFGSLRLRLPEKTGGAHGSKKGKRGYNRASDRHQFRQDWKKLGSLNGNARLSRFSKRD